LKTSATGGGEGLGVYEESHRDIIHPQAYQVYRKVGFEMSLEGGTRIFLVGMWEKENSELVEDVDEDVSAAPSHGLGVGIETHIDPHAVNGPSDITCQNVAVALDP